MVKHKQLARIRRSPSFAEARYFMSDRRLRIGKFDIELETEFLFFAWATL